MQVLWQTILSSAPAYLQRLQGDGQVERINIHEIDAGEFAEAAAAPGLKQTVLSENGSNALTLNQIASPFVLTGSEGPE